jgi:exopolyphosphatase/guanosine-5'-triphosphate,3'-diphosphate pyrophosphatase
MTDSARCACVDIGSNTTRLLVGEREGAELRVLAGDRRFLPLACGPDGELSSADVREVAAAVAAQVAQARAHGCSRVRIVATAAVRQASNRAALCAAVAGAAGAPVEVLSEAQEAAFAFAGATAGTDDGDGPVGVIDIGGGSSELVCGTLGAGVAWWASIPLGSGVLTARHVRSDPPAPAELDAVRADVAAALAPIRCPGPEHALAVGGSAMSLRRVAGQQLTANAIAEALATLGELPAEVAALHFGVDPRRARLMPAGLVLLQAAWDALGAVPLRLADGGLREGVLLHELAE